MNQLHALFTLRNQRAFQRLLDGGADRGQLSSTPASSSGGKSWNRPSAPMSPVCDVNARDWLGRTVLHLACAATDLSAIEYVKLLLAYPTVNVNLCDLESNWTALHRALYAGNIPAARLLLRRSDTDTTVKDFEGYTAFDLYNSTVEGTKPSPANIGKVELFTWGSNRNASLGFEDADDRTSPESVVIGSGEHPASQSRFNTMLLPVNIREVEMSKFHTAVVTHEHGGNLRVCGIGSSGRLGPIHHTQYGLQRIPGFTHTILTVALGQDHTLALTVSGEVLSWGSNRFSQLGYVVEPGPDSTTWIGRAENPIQSSPRKIHGPLKKEFVCGVAASKISSACWTFREVFTWGTNNGQLGHDTHANPVQILPRRVSRITAEVISISMSDHAMACLSSLNEVFCIWNDKVVKLNFPSRLPNDIHVNWLALAPRHYFIKKITTCDDVFAALSFDGELFVFTIPKVSQTENVGIKPQRVWALRKKFTSVADVALGADGTIIICTESGHVFHRSKSGLAKTSKFQRILGFQRVVNVCANSAGAFGALRAEFKPRPLPHTGNSFVQDIAALQLYLSPPCGLGFPQPFPGAAPACSCNASVITMDSRNSEVDEDEDDADIQQDVKTIERLCHILTYNKHVQRDTSASDQIFSKHHADVLLETSHGLEFPVLRVILAARSHTLEELLSGGKTIQDRDSQLSLKLVHVKSQSRKPDLLRLSVRGCHALSLLLLLSYLYTDDLPVLWDPRVAPLFKGVLQKLNIAPKQIQLDLQALARVLKITSLFPVVGSPIKVVPRSSMTQDIRTLLQRTLGHDTGFDAISPKSPIFPDVILQLADAELPCHSAILRSRSVFFADFFDDPDWTVNRWDENGIIKVDMTHMTDRVIRFILQYIYGDEIIFTNNGSMDLDSVDEFLEFAFEVMSAANELLLDRLVLLCSITILEHVNIKNASYILAEATHYNATLLVERIYEYVAANMETFLETGILDDMPDHLINPLTTYIQRKQKEKSPAQRSERLIEAVMRRQSEWLALQDIPQPIIHTATTGQHKHSPKLSPSQRLHQRPSNIESIPSSPVMLAHLSSRNLPPAEDDIFVLDGIVPTPSVQVPASSTAEAGSNSRAKVAWKTGSPIPRVDLKSLMAEAESKRQLKSSQALSVPPILYTRALPGDSLPGAQTSTNEGAQRSEEPGRMSSFSRNTSNLGVTASRPMGQTESPWRKPLIQSPIGLVSPAAPSPILVTAQVGSSQPTRAKEPRSDAHIQGGNYKQSHHIQRGLGPMISPSRQPPGSTSFSRRASGKAWTLPSVQPTTQSSQVGPGASLVAIQEMQLGQDTVISNDKRSFLDIQEEEQARRTEAEFLRWWSAEEQRVKAKEEEILSQILEQSTLPKRQRKPKKKVTAESARQRQDGAP